MSETVLQIENLSKLYRLGEVGTGTISHDLNRWWAKVRGKEDPYSLVGQTNDRSQQAQGDYVWALKDIDFTVQRGEVLGIIGRNGAGKSTLLKILSRITSPSTGSVKSKGRIASLLEVGTGMNPEMTARENIYLNGAILGMTKREIASKFDEIIDFSGCSMYIDTPIKRFSSGMRVRLGFAVAAFLEPEILIVDEVLAVGDAEFQKKAIGKMKDISKTGSRTVLFVSHNMAAVKSLCTRSLLLEMGTITFNGETDTAISNYLGAANDILNFRKDATDHLGFKINGIGVKSKNKDYSEPILRSEPIELVIDYTNETGFELLHFTVKLKGEDGNYFITTGSYPQISVPKGRHTATMHFPEGFFNEGGFFVDLLVVADQKYAFIAETDVVSFIVNPEPKPVGTYMGKELGYLRTPLEWNIL